MFVDQEAHSAADVPARRRRHAGAAAARIDGAGADADAADGRGAGAALRRHLASARRVARLLESAPGREELRVLLHHQAAGAVPQSRRADQRPRHARGDGDRPTSRAATTRAARCCCRARGRGATRSARSSASPSISTSPTSTGRTRSCRRCSSASRTPATSATATGATAAPTRTRSRGRRRRSRCRRRSTRASCSSGCSATAPARRSGCAIGSGTPASSTRSSGSSARSRRSLGAGDKARVDTYVDNIRELERRIRIAMDNAVKEPEGDVPFGLPREQARALPADVRPDGAGVRGRHHALDHVHARPRSERRQLPGVRASTAAGTARRTTATSRRTSPTTRRSTAITCRTSPTSARS